MRLAVQRDFNNAPFLSYLVDMKDIYLIAYTHSYIHTYSYHTYFKFYISNAEIEGKSSFKAQLYKLNLNKIMHICNCQWYQSLSFFSFHVVAFSKKIYWRCKPLSWVRNRIFLIINYNKRMWDILYNWLETAILIKK